MKLFVPACGDRLVLASAWTFPLYCESRNMKFAEAEGLLQAGEAGRWGVWEGDSYRSNYKKIDVTLPAGTVLECDRIYIRTFNKSAKTVEDDFNSITWKIVNKKKNQRFWAKLSDCNKIEFELPNDANFKERAAAEAIENAKKPKKLTADELRTMLYDGSLAGFLRPLREKVLLHLPMGNLLHKKAHDEYVKQEEENRKRYGSYNYSWGHQRGYPYQEILPDTFVELFWNRASGCKFSKRPDGTLARKFSHTDHIYYGYGESSLCSLNGLSFTIVTDSQDLNVIAIEVCEKREVQNT